MKKFLFLILLLIYQSLAGQELRLPNYTLNAGGHEMRDGNLVLRGSVSQPLIQVVASGQVQNSQGFWHIHSSLKNQSTPYFNGQPDFRILTYPNPFDAGLHVTLPEGQWPVRCFLYDLSGRIMGEWVLTAAKNTLALDHLAAGSYILYLRHNHWWYSCLTIKG